MASRWFGSSFAGGGLFVQQKFAVFGCSEPVQLPFVLNGEFLLSSCEFREFEGLLRHDFVGIGDEFGARVVVRHWREVLAAWAEIEAVGLCPNSKTVGISA